MKSNIKKQGDVVIVSLNGKVDYETQEPLKEELKGLIQDKPTDEAALNVIFDMQKLEFVGSSGISQFIQTLKEFGNKTDQKAKILNASSDFRKVMKAFDQDETLEFMELEGDRAPKKHLDQ